MKNRNLRKIFSNFFFEKYKFLAEILKLLLQIPEPLPIVFVEP